MPHSRAIRWIRHSRRQGLAMAVVLMVVSIASIIAFGAAAVSSRNLSFAATDLKSVKARYASEAGIAAALARLKQDAGWRDGFTNVSLPSESEVRYTVTVTNNAGSAAAVTAPDGTTVPPAIVYLQATGTCGGITRRTRVLTRVSQSTVYRYAAYGRSNIVMSSNAGTDSYDSRKGPYNAATNRTSSGSVGTEGSLSLSSNTTVRGNASAASYTLDGTATVTGVRGGAPTFTLPAIDFAAAAASNSNVSGWTLSSGGGQTLAYNASTKALTGKGTITFTQGGTYYFSAIDIDSNSNLVVAPGVTSPVKIYVAGNYTTSSNFAMDNRTQDPHNLQFLVGGSVQVDSNSVFYGSMYAPNGNVTFSSNTTVYGSVISGGQLKIDSMQNIHYDLSLAAVDGDPTPSLVLWERQ